MNSQHLFLFILGMILLLASCTVLLCSNDSHEEYKQLLAYIHKKKFPLVDILLHPPYVMDGEKNLSLVSVLRFVPWVRRIHVFDGETHNDPVEYWKSHQKSRIVLFSQPIVEYCATSPFLESKFLILAPLSIVSNYVFSWTFFRDNKIHPLETRFPHHLYPYEREHLDSIHSFSNVTPKPYHLQHVKSLLHYAEVEKDRKTRPLPLVLCIINNPRDDLQVKVPSEFDSMIQVWVRVVFQGTKELARDRLSILHRMIVSRNVYIELEQQSSNEEQLGARIMRELFERSGDKGTKEKFRVAAVFSFGTNKVAKKLALAYDTVFQEFATLTESDRDDEYWRKSVL